MSLPPPSSKQARVIWFSLTTLAIAALLGLLFLLLWGLVRVVDVLAPVLWPLAIAAIIACVLNPVVNYLVRHKIQRTWAILLTFLAGVLVVGGIGLAVVPRMVSEAKELISRMPTYVTQMQERATELIQNPPRPVRVFLQRRSAAGTAASSTNAPQSQAAPPTREVVGPPAAAGTNAPPPADLQAQLTQRVTDWLSTSLPAAARWIGQRLVKVAGLFGVLVGLGLIPVYTFYLLKEQRGIQDKWTDYLPVRDSRFKDELVWVLAAIQQYLVAFFRGQVLVATCDAVLYTIGFMAIGLNYAFLLGFIAQVLTLVPFIGAMIVCVTAVVLAAVQFHDLLHPLLALGVFGVVQALEGTIIQPKILGDRVGLHPLTVLIAVVVGTTLLGGIIGGILAIPFTAVLRVVMFRYIWKKQPDTPSLQDASAGRTG